MSEKLLLLLPAKRESAWARALRFVAVVAGIAVVLVGLADVCSRLAVTVGGKDALFDAFAPAAALPQRSAVPAAVASTTPAGAFVPARLKVPALGIDAPVEEVGRKADGSMGTPSNFLDAGWWSEGAQPGGKEGSAVFDGHVNNALTKAGVFEHLSQIKTGDYVTLSDAQGHALIYRVSEVDLYDPNQAPRASIFAKTGKPQIVLITCDGEWVQDEHQFNKRLVVVARPV